ncbi:MAG: hypothetical protein JWM16_3723 [Verrucomicrobiales bacterium]|nr:hypothetical protein [Verrucomicrobiales bacterium]
MDRTRKRFSYLLGFSRLLQELLDLRAEWLQTVGVLLKELFLTDAGEQAVEVPANGRGGLGGQAVEPPVTDFLGFNEAAGLQEKQVLGNHDLGRFQSHLEVLHTKRGSCQQIQDAEPRWVAQGLVDGWKFHGIFIYFFQHILQVVCIKSVYP